MKTMTIEKAANMIFASSGDQIWKAWNVEDFTERKLNNFKNKIQKNYNYEIKFIIKL